jgi:hypothetical protein
MIDAVILSLIAGFGTGMGGIIVVFIDRSKTGM